jgi:hypothetical protein
LILDTGCRGLYTSTLTWLNGLLEKSKRREDRINPEFRYIEPKKKRLTFRQPLE